MQALFAEGRLLTQVDVDNMITKAYGEVSYVLDEFSESVSASSGV